MPASRFDQLHRDIIINSDIYGGVKKPKILGTGYGFKGINGIPGLLSSEDIENAILAGATLGPAVWHPIHCAHDY